MIAQIVESVSTGFVNAFLVIQLLTALKKFVHTSAQIMVCVTTGHATAHLDGKVSTVLVDHVRMIALFMDTVIILVYAFVCLAMREMTALLKIARSVVLDTDRVMKQ